MSPIVASVTGAQVYWQAPPWQSLPQAPQFFGSKRTSVQTPSQTMHSAPDGQLATQSFPPEPELTALLEALELLLVD